MSKKVVVILSGGLDSTTLTYDLVHQGYKVYPISFNYGQRHSRELECAKKTCKKLGLIHKVVDISAVKSILKRSALTDNVNVPEGYYSDENMKITVVPNRNMILLSLATAYALSINAKRVYYGAHGGDHAIYFDCREEFVKALGKAIKLCDWKQIDLEAPYLYMTKVDIVRRGIDLGVTYEDTHTCYKGGAKPCLRCGSCLERIEAFLLNDAKDPLLSDDEWNNAIEHLKTIKAQSRR